MKAKQLSLVFILTIGLLLLAGALALPVSAGDGPAVAQVGGGLILVSVASDGTPGDIGSMNPAISADGRHVAFQSYATNLVSGDTNNKGDIFAHDLQTRTITRVAVASDGTQANDYSYTPAISADGRYVVFQSYATNLVSGDTNGRADVFVRDRDTDGDGIFDEPGQVSTTLVSVDSGGAQGNHHSYAPAISADGRYVAFYSAAGNLVSGDTNGQADIFVHDRQTGQTTRVSVASDGAQGDSDSYAPAISADGRYVAFYSAAGNLVDNDTNSKVDIFVHDRQTGATTRVSVASDGTQGNDNSLDPAISADGRYVAFRSAADNLVDDDTNSREDVFVHDRQTGQTTRVSVPDCGGQGNGNSDRKPALSADGRYVAFPSSAQNLVGGDSDYRDTFVRDRALGQTALVSAAPDSMTGLGDTCAAALSPDGRYVAFGTGDCVSTGHIYVRDRGSRPPSDAPAQLLHVSTGGSDVAGCGSTAAPCRTVQQAVNQASCGATVKVATGVYTDVHLLVSGASTLTQVLYLPRQITVTGGYTAGNWDTSNPEANPTTLDAQGQGRVIYIYAPASESMVLEGLRLVNGQGTRVEAFTPDGGGIRTSDQAHLTIRNCDIMSNTAVPDSMYPYYSFGGGVYLYGGTLALENSRIVSNTAAMDGGGVFVREATVTMTHNLLERNVGRAGGGAWVYESTAYVADNTFQRNTATAWGGGLQVTRGDLVLTRNSVLNNTANAVGGGFSGEVDAGHAHTISHNTFQGNVANPNGSGTGGGASLSGASGGQLVFSHNRVLDNVASTGPTGANGGQGGGLRVSGPAQVADNLFQGNWASSAPPQGGYYYGGYGGGLYLAGQGLQVERNRILDNRAARNAGINYTSEALGGGVYVATYATVTMTNNILVGNVHCEECTAHELSIEWFRGGGAIAVRGSPYASPPDTHLYLYHNTVADNQTSAIRNESGAAISMSHNVLSGHTTDLSNVRKYDYVCPTTEAHYSLWWPNRDVAVHDLDNRCSEPVTGHDFTGDPAFVSTALDNYHLGAASQAIDRGPGVGVSSDIDGHLRPAGAGYDLGADEYTGVDLSPSWKAANPLDAGVGEVVTFTIVLRNSGDWSAPNTVLFDAIPTQTTYVAASAQATSGVLTDTDGIAWSGSVATDTPVTITFQVTINQAVPIQNTAVISDGYGAVFNLVAWVNARRVYLPLALRQSP